MGTDSVKKCFRTFQVVHMRCSGKDEDLGIRGGLPILFDGCGRRLVMLPAGVKDRHVQLLEDVDVVKILQNAIAGEL